MTARYDLENMAPEEIEKLRNELRASPAMRQLLDDLRSSEEEAVDVDLLSDYIRVSSIANRIAEPVTTVRELRAEDIEYVEAMIEYSPAWSAVHQKLLTDMQAASATGMVTEPLKPYHPQSSPLFGWLSGKPFAFKFALSSLSFAALFLAVIVFMPEYPPLSELHIKKPSVTRSGEFGSDRGMPELASDLANGKYSDVIESVEKIRGQGTVIHQIECELLLAKSYLYDAENNMLGLYHWFDDAALQQSLHACNTALSMTATNAAMLGSYKNMEYTSQALVVKTTSLHLLGQDADAIQALKELSDLKGPENRMVRRLQKYIR